MQSLLPIGAVTSDLPWRSQLGEGPDHQLSVMECPVMEVDSVTSAIKRQVKDRIPKTKLNASLASKVKTKIKQFFYFQDLFKAQQQSISLGAKWRERENSGRIPTEKIVLQKQAEKLKFENTFLHLTLNNLINYNNKSL